MSRRLWRCRNPGCGAVLGRLTLDGNGLTLTGHECSFLAFLDGGRVTVRCPRCGQFRDFRGTFLTSTYSKDQEP